MGSCVSKKAARAGAGGRVATPLPPEKEKEPALPPAVLVEEEVKEVLTETPVPRPPRPPSPEKEKVKRVKEDEAEEEVSESPTADKTKSMAGGKQEAELRAAVAAADSTDKRRARRRTPEQMKPKDAGNRRARSPSPASANRRQSSGELPAAPRPRREQPAVVSGIGCRSGRFSPSAARRAAESAVRRTHSAREADMALPPGAASRTPAKRSLNAAINGNGNARRDPGERSGRRPDSPTAKRPPASPAASGAANHRQANPGVGATRKPPKEITIPEQTKPQCGGGGRAPGDAGDEPDEAALEGGGEHKEAAEGALGQNPSVAMECFIFL